MADDAIRTLGLSVLREVSSLGTGPGIDAVLIHEFGGHAEITWEGLKSGLGAECEDVRILTFGYSERGPHPYCSEQLLTHAESLLWDLYQCRQDEDTRTRPIIFFSRGPGGGFIAKKTIVAARRDVRYRDISSCTLGVAFSSAIHQPFDGMNWRTLLGKVYESMTLHQFLGKKAPGEVQEEDEQSLDDLVSDFAGIPGLLILDDNEDGIGDLVDMGEDVPKSARLVVEDYNPDDGELCDPEVFSRLVTHMRDRSPKTNDTGRWSNSLDDILRLLRPPKVRQDAVPKPRTKGTCSWVNNNPHFTKWRTHDPNHRLLWMEGPMGCGKTYLARHVVGLIDDPRETVAYCRIGDLVREYRTPETVLAWLLYDIVLARPELADATKLAATITHAASTSPQGSRPDPAVCHYTFYEAEQLWATVMDQATQHGRVTLVVDEIDQLDERHLGEFVEFMSKGSDDIKNVKDRTRLLFLSRKTAALESALQGCGFTVYDITKADTEPDIDRTIDDFLSVIKSRFNLTPDLVAKIREKIRNGANGMYLWAHMELMGLVKKLRVPGWTEGSLLAVSREIYGIYERYLAKLTTSGGSFAQHVLFWMTYQLRPMPEHELRTACALSSCVPDIKAEEWPRVRVDESTVTAFESAHGNMRGDTLDLCNPLIDVGLDQRLSLVHNSLQDFLKASQQPATAYPGHTHFHCDEKKANRNISFLCVDYLLRFDNVGEDYKNPPELDPDWHEKVMERRYSEDHCFIEYAALYWIPHARLSGSPYDAEFEEWPHHPVHEFQQLFLIGPDKNDSKGYAPAALSWYEVWWQISRSEKDPFPWPKPGVDLRRHFPDMRLRLEAPGWGEVTIDVPPMEYIEIRPEDKNPQAVFEDWDEICDGKATVKIDLEAEAELAKEIEKNLRGLMGWMGQLKLDIGSCFRRAEAVMKDLGKARRALDTVVDPTTGLPDPGKVDHLQKEVERLQKQVDDAKADVETAGEQAKNAEDEAERAKAIAEDEKKNHKELEKRHHEMIVYLKNIKESLKRSKELLEAQKADRGSWNFFRR